MSKRDWIGAAAAAALLGHAAPAAAQAASPPAAPPASPDPYPSTAAGWGAEAGGGRMISRWAEAWTGARTPGAFKAIALGDDARLSLGAEFRWRRDVFDNARLTTSADDRRDLVRGVIGADLRLNTSLRIYGEVAVGRVEGGREVGANFRNDAFLQQLFVEVRRTSGSTLLGAMVGRQEFADGPRQLISLGDGPNIHRTWNGIRLYAHGRRLRLGAFDFRATRLGGGGFDEAVNHDERLQGISAGLVVSSPGEAGVYLEPFWLHSENPAFRAGGTVGLDERDTYGLRLWGRRGAFRFDWTAVQQRGDHSGRPVRAWGVFAVQSLALSEAGWKPRLTSRLDLASGGTGSAGPLKTFNPLYSSSNYLGEGQFLGLSNLALAALGVSLSPTASTTVSVEYGAARRLETADPAYAGQLRPYDGTAGAPGKAIGDLTRVSGSWRAGDHLDVVFNLERMAPADLLRRTGARPGGYGYVGVTFRY